MSSLNPAIGMTDHDEALRNSLKSVWPSITLLLCIFHILQAVWRYLFSKESGISATDRRDIFSKFKSCVYADQVDIEVATLALFQVPNLTIQCKTYLSKLWTCSSDWMRGVRSVYLTRGHDTNNYCEISVRLPKEAMMNRIRARSLGQLLGTLTVNFDAYYSSRLLEFSSSRKNISYLYFKSSSAFKKSQQISREFCIRMAGFENRFECQSLSTPELRHQVDLHTQICSSDQGIVGKVCKHMIVIPRHYGIELFHLPPQTAQPRLRLAMVAYGASEQISFYENLNEYKHLHSSSLVEPNEQDFDSIPLADDEGMIAKYYTMF